MKTSATAWWMDLSSPTITSSVNGSVVKTSSSATTKPFTVISPGIISRWDPVSRSVSFCSSFNESSSSTTAPLWFPEEIPHLKQLMMVRGLLTFPAKQSICIPPKSKIWGRDFVLPRLLMYFLKILRCSFAFKTLITPWPKGWSLEMAFGGRKYQSITFMLSIVEWAEQ